MSTPPATEADYGHLVGHRFPGGSYTLPEYVSWLWADCALAKPDPAAAHPSIGYFVAMQGLGASIQDIFDLLGASADSGVMFGETDLEFNGALVPGTTYDCSGEIVEVERKSGKRAGVFDKMTFRIDVRERGAQEPVVSCRNTWIFPRRSA